MPKLGLPISLAMHTGLILGGIALFGGETEAVVDVPIINVEAVTIDELTNIKAAVKAPDPDPDTAPMEIVEPEPVAPPESEPEPEPIVEALPSEPKPAPVPDPVAETEPVPKSEPEPEPTAEPEPTFDLNSLSALVDRSRTAQPEITQDALLSERNRPATDAVNRAGQGLQTALTINELDELRRRMLSCWRMPADAPEPEKLIVHVGLDLTRDGRPSHISLVAPSTHSTTDPFMKIAQDRALRAVEKCAPYDFLPQEKYSSWRTIEMTFSSQGAIKGYIEPLSVLGSN